MSCRSKGGESVFITRPNRVSALTVVAQANLLLDDHNAAAFEEQPPPQKTEVFCPSHPDQLIKGNGEKYFLHLLQTGEAFDARLF